MILHQFFTLCLTIRRLVNELGLNVTLSDYKVPEGDFEKIAKTLVPADDHAGVARIVGLLKGLLLV